MGTITLRWICPECGCNEPEPEPCATIGVVCGCCGDFSFMPGATEADFYNYLLSCPRCGAHWEGHDPPSPCSENENPTRQILEASFPTPSYTFQALRTGHWEVAPDLLLALDLHIPGTKIYDNCGNEIAIQE